MIPTRIKGIYMNGQSEGIDAETLKSCCKNFYENDLVGAMFGENFHPGGEQLTLHLGEKCGLDEGSKVLDVACGPGSSALVLAKEFGCNVVGVDLSEKNLSKAKERAEAMGLSNRVEFKRSDAEGLGFDDSSFDVVYCECSLCTFPDKVGAVGEMFRVLRNGGKVGITDMTLERELPEHLKGILSYVTCVSGALSVSEYRSLLSNGGFKHIQYEDQGHTVMEMVEKVEKVAFGLKFIEKFCECDLKEVLGITIDEAKDYLKEGKQLVEKGEVGYGLFLGIKD